MKKLILAALLMCIAFVDYGQLSISLVPYSAALAKKSTPDTLVNVDTTYLYLNTLDLRDYHINAVLTNTKVSGTISGGTIIMQGTNETTNTTSTNWWTLKNYATQSVSSADTVTLTNATITMDWNLNASFYRYLRFRIISAGTQTCVPTGTVYYYPALIKNLN